MTDPEPCGWPVRPKQEPFTVDWQRPAGHAALPPGYQPGDLINGHPAGTETLIERMTQELVRRENEAIERAWDEATAKGWGVAIITRTSDGERLIGATATVPAGICAEFPSREAYLAYAARPRAEREPADLPAIQPAMDWYLNKRWRP